MITEDDIRRIALSLPATTEKPSYGTPGFRVKLLEAFDAEHD
jgi:hypothetical protein